VLLRIEAGRGEPKDLELLLSLSGRISGKVLCALGDFATSPVVATIQHFRSEYLAAMQDGRGAGDDWSQRA
jgi:NADH-quinone oxidoreductase subunit F